MQIKMINVVNASGLYEKIKDQVLPIKLNYKFNKLFSKINSEAEFYQIEFQKILMKYAEKMRKAILLYLNLMTELN